MMSALTLASMNYAGCAKTNKIVVHPLESDFRLVKKGETVSVQKDGALVSNEWLLQVAGVATE